MPKQVRHDSVILNLFQDLVTYNTIFCYIYTDKQEKLFLRIIKMKKIIAVLSVLVLTTLALFAQSADMTQIAVVKLNKNEFITLKQLKARCLISEKEVGRNLTVDERKEVLDTLIKETLMVQAAAKAGINISDSAVDQYFIQYMSQLFGVSLTEKEMEEVFKKQYGKSLDEVLLEQTGMNKVEYKKKLKNTLMMQQYVVQKKQDEIQKVAATDEEIRMAYESNKSSFVWNDMVNLFMVIVPKGSNPDTAKDKATDLLNKYTAKTLSADQIAVQSQADNSGYQAGQLLLPKTEAAANGIGMSFQNFMLVFQQSEGYISDLGETSDDYRFLSIIKKYNAKMLAIGDIVQPETTVTVYDYIRSNLTQQKQQLYLNTAAQDLAKELHTSENVDMKKTGDALTKLLDWGN